MSKENKATLTTAHKVTQSDSRLIEKGVFSVSFFFFLFLLRLFVRLSQQID